MKHRYHDAALWAFVNDLRRRGLRVAEEVGIPGGRIDAVRLGKRGRHGRWLELYELKTQFPETGIGQLVRYARHVEGRPLLTLVVDTGTVTPEISALAAEADVRIREFAFANGLQLSLLPLDVGFDYLPYIHPESLARADQRRAEWLRQERAWAAADKAVA